MKSVITLSLFIMYLFVQQGKGQDVNYWQSPYNPGGMLTPGAVIAYDGDSGLYYFNPALLAIKPKSSISVSADIYDFHSLKIKNGVGTSKNLKSSGFAINPLMVAGTLSFKMNKTISLGYALIQDPLFSFESTQREDTKKQVLDDSYSPGTEYLVANFWGSNIVRRTVASGSVAVRLNKKLCIGLTIEGRFRNQYMGEQYIVRALINTPDTSRYIYPMTSVGSSYSISYWHAAMRFKGGVSYDEDKHHIGLIVTSPLLSVKGKATLTSEVAVSDLHVLDGSNTVYNLLASGRQEKLPVKYKIPLSIGAGYAYDYDKGQFYVSGEYFLPVRAYNIVTPRNESFIRPDTGGVRLLTSSLLQFWSSNNSLFNWSVGMSYKVNDVIKSYISLSSDYNYAGKDAPEANAGVNSNTSTWDLYHCQLGANIKRRKANLHAGVVLTYGAGSNYYQPVNFDNPNESNILRGEILAVKGSFFSAGLLLSYIHNL